MEPPQPNPPAGALPGGSDAAEHRVIDQLLSRRGPRPAWVRLDAGHDCAVVDDGLTVTVDAMVEGLHFDHRLSAADVGFKGVAVSVSDLVATRARPRWMLLALSLPRAWTDERRADWVDGFATGIAEAGTAFGVYLVGGDVTAVPADGPVYVSSTLGGLAVDRPRGRAGARPGDRLWVTGWPGLAGSGWMDDHPPPASLRALRRPAPPLAFGLDLAEATAAMDLSDGLGADLPRLAAASGVAIDLDAAAIPVHPALAGHPELLRAQIRGGEDFQLLFTAPESASAGIRALGASTGTEVTPIGRVSAGSGVRLVGADWPAAAFAHFAGSASGAGS